MSPAHERRLSWDEVRRRLDEAHRSLDREAAPDPAQVRETLRERARELARLPFEEEGHHDREFITFELAGGRYGIDSTRVLEIGRARELAPLPGAPAPLLGITPWRGSILLLLDLASLLGRDATWPERPLMVVLDGAEAPFGVPVGAMHDVLRLRNEEIGPVPDMIHRNREFVTGVAAGDVMILDGDALLRRRIRPG